MWKVETLMTVDVVLSCARTLRLLKPFAFSFVTLLGCIVVPVGAQAPKGVVWSPYDLPHLQQTTLSSFEGAPYRIIVAKPVGPAPAKGYPVIYVVDGNAYTALVSEMIRFNRDVGVQSHVEPAVVVGIGYPTTEAYDLSRRTFDFTSKATTQLPGITPSQAETGGDLLFMDFIDHSVKPLIASEFKIDSSRQTLLGHSLGGLFTLAMMINRPGSFQTYVAISPSIWWNSNALLGQMQHFLESTRRPAKLRVFLSIGMLEQYMSPGYVSRTRYFNRDASKPGAVTDSEADKDNREMRAKTMVTNVQRLATGLVAAHVQTDFVQFPNQDHFSVVPAALGEAVSFAFADNLTSEQILMDAVKKNP